MINDFPPDLTTHLILKSDYDEIDETEIELLFATLLPQLEEKLTLLIKKEIDSFYPIEKIHNVFTKQSALLSVEQKRQIGHMLIKHIEEGISIGSYYTSDLIEYLIYWQHQVNKSSDEKVSFIDDFQEKLTSWHIANLNWHNHVDKDKLFPEMVACGLCNEANCEKIFNDIHQINYDNEYQTRKIFNGRFNDYIDFFTDFSSYFGIESKEIIPLEEPDEPYTTIIVPNTIVLNPEPDVNCMVEPDLYNYEILAFNYQNQAYQMTIRRCRNNLLYGFSLMNSFLEKINHHLRFYYVFNNDDIDSFCALDYKRFETVNQLLKLPVELITCQKHGFIPEDLSSQFALVNPEYHQAISTGQCMLANKCIELPTKLDSSSRICTSWIKEQLSMASGSIKAELTSILKQNKSIDDQLKQAIKLAVFYRNLLIALLRYKIFDVYFANSLYKQLPLWNSEKQQQIFDDMIANNTANKTVIEIVDTIQEQILNPTDMTSFF